MYARGIFLCNVLIIMGLQKRFFYRMKAVLLPGKTTTWAKQKHNFENAGYNRWQISILYLVFLECFSVEILVPKTLCRKKFFAFFCNNSCLSAVYMI